MWMYLGLLAALFLGLHNLCKKHAVRNNEVYGVLLGTITAGFLVLLPLYLGSRWFPSYFKEANLFVYQISLQTHLLIVIKALIMATSWVLAYQALKHLPITIVTPIRSAGPFFTFLGAMLIYQERPNPYQWIGFFIIILSVFLYSQIGKKEGIIFKSNKWIYAIIAATFLGASSGLYDKYLVQTVNLNPPTLQFWFCTYTMLIVGLIVLIKYRSTLGEKLQFDWRWSIPLVGVLLQFADYFYFKALQDPEALIMLLSAIKRSQLLIAVLLGGVLFKEQNKRKKLVPLFGILLGVFLILYSG
ncbi:permease [Croceivirga lutea]|uniref:EamA family transporter n=1 Tax=Croceivirga lutea TaxID=1775167 RepID=UPI00163A35E2|nr:EamA family transporter [Croceivirga lutea]GGG45523.1 permease [Croceivirga lutea]